MGKKKILYFASVEWSWIKQRPQFLAEELSHNYNIVYTTKSSFKRIGNKSEAVKCWHLFRLPFESYSIINTINKWLIKLQLSCKTKCFDAVWLTSPSQYEYFKGFKKLPFLIYDCMDDMVEFHSQTSKRNAIINNEKKLVERADVIFCSSKNLADKLTKRYGVEKISIVNNAIKSDLPPLPQHRDGVRANNSYIISYFGTISEWMDWHLLNQILDRFSNVEIHLYGPCAVTTPSRDRLVFEGSISHDNVFEKMNEADCLIMPFVITELIKSVNPVKLYEYIYSGKNCLAPLYGESEPFSDFVYLYENPEQCLEIISQIMTKDEAKAPLDKCVSFAKANTWEARANTILGILNQRLK